MHRILTLAVGLASAGLLCAQQSPPKTYGTLNNFGNVLYPGTGHAPNGAPGFGFGNGRGQGAPPRVSHPSHSRTVVVPYPVYVGGYYGGYSGYDTPANYSDQPVQYAPQQASPPVVIINQGYRPDTANPVMHDYSEANYPDSTVRTYDAPVYPIPDPKERAAARAEAERPTIFLIAFKDHTILPALAYWMEGDTLNYVSKEGTPNRVSLSLVDREFSRQLNRERNVEFNLP